MSEYEVVDEISLRESLINMMKDYDPTVIPSVTSAIDVYIEELNNAFVNYV